MNKKTKIKKALALGGLLIIGLYVGLFVREIVITKPTPYTGEVPDTIDMYDDKEFYYMTHNEDGSVNEYGKSLE